MTDTVANAKAEVADVATDALGQARDAASAAAGAAAEEAATVAVEVKDQAIAVVGSVTGEVEAQLESRLDEVVGRARVTAEELRALCDGRPEDAGASLDKVRRLSEQLDAFAERTEGRGLRGLASDASDLARRRPLVFLAGALAAGVAVGRLGRAAAADAPTPTSSPSSSPDSSPDLGPPPAGPPGLGGPAGMTPADPGAPVTPTATGPIGPTATDPSIIGPGTGLGHMGGAP